MMIIVKNLLIQFLQKSIFAQNKYDNNTLLHNINMYNKLYMKIGTSVFETRIFF